MKKYFYCLIMAACFCACREKKVISKPSSDPLLYCKTVKKLNDVVLFNNFPPMIASRNYVYANIAAYECVAAGDSNYLSLSGQIRHMPGMPKPDKGKEIDFSLAALLSFVKVGNSVTFPEGVLMDYWEELKENALKNGISDDVLENTIGFSDTIAASIMAWSKKDNYAQTRSAERFTIQQLEGRWVPTPPAYAQAAEPHWCDIRPMVLDSAAHFMPPPPPAFNMKDSNSRFYREAMEVKRTVENLTEEQKHIAEFFDDNPFNLHVSGHIMYATKKFSPPGHWMNIVGIAAEKSKADFNTTVASYTATAIALFDGFIACWKSKYTSNMIRPETVINQHLDPSWRPLIQTPPFPSYISGHSVISAASAETMSYFYGDDFAYRDTSLNEYGIKPRSFQSFRQASLEASWSRLYGGIHFRSDLEQGNLVGIKLGQYIVNRLKMTRKQPYLTANNKK